MLYAVHAQDGTTIVAAASTLAEYDNFYASVVSDHAGEDGAFYVSERQPDIMEMMTDPYIGKFKKPPYIFSHLSPSQREEFANRYALQVIGKNALISKAEDMLADVLDRKAKAAGTADTRTIAEVLGIDKEDPWDKRTEEKKAEQEEKDRKYKEEYEKAKKEGRLSGDSFGGPADNRARITDVHVTKNADGSIKVEHVRAVKGLHESTKDEAFSAEERVRVRQDAVANPGDYFFEPGKTVEDARDDKYEPISRRARDYIFAISEDDLNGNGAKTVTVTITSKALYPHTEVVEDRPLSGAIGHLLPQNAIEIENAIFAMPGDRETMHGVMESQGFTHDAALQDVVDGIDPVQRAVSDEEHRIREDAKANPDTYLSEKFSEPQSKNPDDYGFAAWDSPDPSFPGTVVTITRRRIFDIIRQPDQIELAGALADVLPQGMGELQEGEFEFPGTPDEAVEAMKKAGFVHHSKLQQYCNTKVAETKQYLAQHAAPNAVAQPANHPSNNPGIIPPGIVPPGLGGPQKPSGARAKGRAPAGVISEDHDENAGPIDRGPAINYDAHGDNIAIANDGFVSVYFKVEVVGAKLADVIPVLEAEDFPMKSACEQRDHKAGCWLAFVRERSASEAVEILTGQKDESFVAKPAGSSASLYGVNEMGERLAPEEIEIVDTGKVDETPIRPWNYRKVNWDDLTDEEKAENRKEWSGKEFILVCEYDRNTGCKVFIQPKSYFYDNKALYPEELDLSHLLPADLKSVGDNWYETKSRDDNKLMFELCVQRKFIDDWMLRLYLNNPALYA